jgi:hypothetical protein
MFSTLTLANRDRHNGAAVGRGNRIFISANRRYSVTKLLTALTVVTILTAMAAAGPVKPKFFSTVGAGAALPTVTISVEELQRQVDVRTLPVTEVESLY